MASPDYNRMQVAVEAGDRAVGEDALVVVGLVVGDRAEVVRRIRFLEEETGQVVVAGIVLEMEEEVVVGALVVGAPATIVADGTVDTIRIMVTTVHIIHQSQTTGLGSSST